MVSVLNSINAFAIDMADTINSNLQETPPSQVVVLTALASFAAYPLLSKISHTFHSINWNYYHKIGWKRTMTFTLMKLAYQTPFGRKAVEKELSKHKRDMEASIFKHRQFAFVLNTLPAKGWTNEQILDLLKERKKADVDWSQGGLSGTVYSSLPHLQDLFTEVFARTWKDNPLHGGVFPAACQAEAEVIRIACNLFHGNEKTCGSLTSGGTESIFSACKAYRDRKGVTSPNMVIPSSAHAAFKKAAKNLGIEVFDVPVDPETSQVDPQKVEKAINTNTIMIVGSAPSYPHGIIDPLKELSDIAVKKAVPLHVDACLGGFVAAFAGKAGRLLPLFDFRLPGVTSISADTHKYGYAAKGSSLILYRNEKLRHYQYFDEKDWSGGIYATPTLAGSRPGTAAWNAWAALLSLGEEGYVQEAKKILATRETLEKALRQIPEIQVIGQPQVSVIGIKSTTPKLNIYRLLDEMKGKGWELNALQDQDHNLKSIHICLTGVHGSDPTFCNRFVNDIKACITKILQSPEEKSDTMALYGTTQQVPPEFMGDMVNFYLDAVYQTQPREEAAWTLPEETPSLPWRVLIQLGNVAFRVFHVAHNALQRREAVKTDYTTF